MHSYQFLAGKMEAFDPWWVIIQDQEEEDSGYESEDQTDQEQPIPPDAYQMMDIEVNGEVLMEGEEDAREESDDEPELILIIVPQEDAQVAERQN